MPVRITKTRPFGHVDAIADYSAVERLPLDADHESLLHMTPHPGAKVIDERG